MNNLPYAIFAEISRRILSAKSVAIFAHKNPDGDSLGATIALSLMLDSLGIRNTLFAADEPGANFRFLPKYNYFEKEFQPADFDLAIIPDIGDIHQLKYDEKLFENIETIRIDHHPTGNFEPTMKWVDPNFAASCEMLTEFFRFAKWHITPDIATCLLTGIYTDTGSFMHSNTTSHTLRIANYLTRLGGNNRALSKSIFQTTPISTMKLWGKVLSRIEKNEEGVVFSAVKQKDYEECEAKREELAGVVDYLNAVEGKYSMLLTEEEAGVKASLRTQAEDVDVSAIAKDFGGGGHVKAAGFTIPGRLKAETHWRVVEPEGEVSIDINSSCEQEK